MGTALITGASSGLGLEFAWQLASAGHHLVLVARDEARLTRIAHQINGVCGVDVEVLRADLAVRSDVDRVAARLGADRSTGARRVTLLVNNAGYSTGQPFIGGDLESEERMLDVMVRAVMVLTHAAIDAMVPRGRGCIINVSSVAAQLASGTYSASKAWVRTFTESIAEDLRGTGVSATAVCPGLVHTEFHRRADIDYSGIPEIAWLRADTVVSQALDDARHRMVLSTPSVRYAVLGQVTQRLPRFVVRALSRGPSAR